MTRWTSTKRRPTAEEQRAIRQAKALSNCQQGKHRLTATFRAGEQICTVCNVVFYCAACLQENSLAKPQGVHAYPLACPKHQEAMVQA